MFSGAMTALITPFSQGNIDWKSLDDLIERQIEQGISALVICGTTGESATLSNEEHMSIVKRSVDVVKGRIPIIAGSGCNSTTKTVDTTQMVKECGADAALIVTPYYNKPTQEGLYYHYKMIAESVSIPIILYNVPGRSIVDLTNETVSRLSKIPNIVGIKDATGDVSRVTAIKTMAGDDFAQLTGDDFTTFEYYKEGGNGCVSVSSNIAPDLSAALYSTIQGNDLKSAEKINQTLLRITEAMFFETSPIPAKYALSQMGLCQNELRLPLTTASAECVKQVDEMLEFVSLGARKLKAA